MVSVSFRSGSLERGAVEAELAASDVRGGVRHRHTAVRFSLRGDPQSGGRRDSRSLLDRLERRNRRGLAHALGLQEIKHLLGDPAVGTHRIGEEAEDQQLEPHQAKHGCGDQRLEMAAGVALRDPIRERNEEDCAACQDEEQAQPTEDGEWPIRRQAADDGRERLQNVPADPSDQSRAAPSRAERRNETGTSLITMPLCEAWIRVWCVYV